MFDVNAMSLLSLRCWGVASAIAFTLFSAIGVDAQVNGSAQLDDAVRFGMMSDHLEAGDLCFLSSVKLSPDGRRVALFNRQSSSMDDSRNDQSWQVAALVEIDLRSVVIPAGRVLSSNRGLDMVGWLPDGRAVLQQGQSGLLFVPVTKGRRGVSDIEISPLPEHLRASWLRGAGPLPSAASLGVALNRTAGLLKTLGAPWATLLLSRDEVKAVSLNPLKTGHNLVELTNGRWRDLHRNASTTMSPLPIRNTTDELLPFFPGDLLDERTGGARQATGLPLIDEANGRAIGTYTAWSMEGLADSGRIARVPIKASQRLIAASASGDRFAFLVQQDDRRRLVVQRSDGAVIARLDATCGRTAPVPKQPVPRGDDEGRLNLWLSSIAGVDRQRRFSMPNYDLVDLDPTRRLVGQLVNNGADTVVVVFGGGPGGAVLDGDNALALDTLLAHRADILSVSYSGSADSGLHVGERLRDAGMSALRDDATSVATWLRERRPRRVIVLGISFGAVPALQLAGTGLPNLQVLLEVPLLKLVEPEEWRSCRSPSITDARQRRFEESIFGGRVARKRFQTDLAALVARWRSYPNDGVQFGVGDCKSSEADLPPGFAGRVWISPGRHAPTPNRAVETLQRQLGLSGGQGAIVSDRTMLNERSIETGQLKSATRRSAMRRQPTSPQVVALTDAD